MVEPIPLNRVDFGSDEILDQGDSQERLGGTNIYGALTSQLQSGSSKGCSIRLTWIGRTFKRCVGDLQLIRLCQRTGLIKSRRERQVAVKAAVSARGS